MFKNILTSNSTTKLGILLGLYLVAQALVVYNLGLYFEKNIAVSIISMVVTFGAIFIGIRQVYLKNIEGGMMSIIKTGITISFIAAVVYVAYSLLFVYSFKPEIIDLSLDQSRTLLEERNMPEEDIAKSLEMTRQAFMPSMILGILLFNVFFGFIASIVSGFFLKLKK